MSLMGAAAITAGASLLNTAFQGYQNKVDKKFTREMYERQLADSRENWRLQNEYNSPLQQQIRLAEAGLNPNLVYGQGAVANSASQPGNVTPPSWHQVAPNVDPSSLNVMAQMLSIKKMQLDNEGAALENRSKELGVQKEEANSSYYADNARLINEQLSIAVDTAWQERNIQEAQAYLSQVNKAFTQYVTHVDMPYQDSEKDFKDWCNKMQDALGSSYGQDWLSKLEVTPTQLAKAKADISFVFKQCERLGWDIVHIQKQNRYLDASTRKMAADADYQEFKNLMIKNGVNIDDPIWARALAAFLNGLSGGDGIMSWISNLGDSFGKDVALVKDIVTDDKTSLTEKGQQLLNIYLMKFIHFWNK